jgi:hypothetical protein
MSYYKSLIATLQHCDNLSLKILKDPGNPFQQGFVESKYVLSVYKSAVHLSLSQMSDISQFQIKNGFLIPEGYEIVDHSLIKIINTGTTVVLKPTGSVYTFWVRIFAALMTAF